MKRIRCPKCDESILFDETKYEPGRILVFECPECHKQFKIRIPQPKVAQSDAEEEEEEKAPEPHKPPKFSRFFGSLKKFGSSIFEPDVNE